MNAAVRVLPILALGFVAAACGGDDDSTSESTPAPAPSEAPTTAAGTAPATDAEPPATEAASGPAVGEAGYLTSVCPDPIKIQLQWYPQPDPYAMDFGLISDGTLDAEAATYSGPAAADPDQTIEIIGGGPLVGFQNTTSLMYADPDILLGDLNMDESIAQSKNFPTVGVLAPFLTSPQALMFSPDAIEATSISDLKELGTTVLVTQSATFAQALIELGLLDESQVDFSFDFSPARFVDAEGAIAQQGFITSDEFEYEHSDYWGKPVDHLLLSDEYPIYQNVMVVTPDKLESEADCLTRLVPLMQQSMVDYFVDPTPINDILVDVSTELGNPAVLTAESLGYAADTMLGEGLVGNTPGTETFGAFDAARVEEFAGIVVPLFAGQENIDPDVTADQLFTNEFVDPSIGFAG